MESKILTNQRHKLKCQFLLYFWAGSASGGVDVVDKQDVGLTNHVSFHGLNLQNGHKYFVSVTGMSVSND